MIVVGDVVCDRGDLGLEARPGRQPEVVFGVRFNHRPGRRRHWAIVLSEAFERFPTKVEAIEVGIRRLQLRHEPDAVRIMVEPAGIGESGVQRGLSGMTKRWVTKIVGKAERFGQILVQAQSAGNGPADLRDLDAVRQPDPEMIAIGRDEDLGLVAKAAESDRVHDAIAVALENVARTTRSEIMLGMKAATRPVGPCRQP